jgi:hypothetical protein
MEITERNSFTPLSTLSRIRFSWESSHSITYWKKTPTPKFTKMRQNCAAADTKSLTDWRTFPQRALKSSGLIGDIIPIFVNNQPDAQFFLCMFIYILYMFRAAMYPSSEELIVSIRHLVYVTLYRRPFSIQVSVSSKPAHQTIIYTEWHIPDVLIQLILLMMGTRLPETCRE